MPRQKREKSMNNSQIKNNEPCSTKRSSSIETSHKIKQKSSGSKSKRYKVVLPCIVCDGNAHGYNFDAISCESCKAFFRRNAQRPSEKLKCSGNGECNIKFYRRKHCKKCRLEKCFKAGMRKEWILTAEEKAGKSAKIEANRLLKQIHDNNLERQKLAKKNSKINNDFSLITNQLFLTDPDLLNIQSIQDYFIDAVRLNQISGICLYPSIQSIESTLELFRVPLYIISMRLVTFVKQINEFHQLDKREQVHLIKLNLILMSFFHSIYIYDPRTDCYHEEDTIYPLFSGKDWIKTLNKQFHLEMKQLRNDLLDIFQMDKVIIKIFFLILLFSNQLSLNQSRQCSLTDIQSLSIFHAQNVYTDLLYRYCLQQYGLVKTPILFTRYTMKIFKLQQLVDNIKYQINDYMDITQLIPLTQSLLL